MLLKNLIKNSPKNLQSLKVTGLSLNSKKIKKGFIFFAIRGNKLNGENYIDEAIKKGATVLDVDLEDYAKKYRKKLKCKVIGITGSAGKTTVKDMLYSVLSQKYNVIKTYENQNNEVGVPLTVLKADANTDILIVEMAIRKPGDMKLLTQIVRPNHVVITNIGRTHVQFFKHLKQLATEKSNILQNPLNWENKNRVCYLNETNTFYEFLLKKAQKKDFQILPFKGQNKIDENINLCYTVGRQFDLSDEEIKKGLEKIERSSHRMKSINHQDITVIDDTYNSNPDGVQYALEYIKYLNGRKLVVLGDMLELGEFSEQAHQQAINQASEYGVEVLYTLGEAFNNIKIENNTCYQFLSREKLHDLLIKEIKPGDKILVKGSRGMQMEKTVEFILNHYKTRA